jgi:hypothetical protein
MIRAGEFRVERELPRAVRAAMKTNRCARATARNIFVDCLANARLEFNEIARQINHDVALFPVHGIQLDSKFCSGVIGLATTVSSHASHISVQSLSQRKPKRSMFNAENSVAR